MNNVNIKLDASDLGVLVLNLNAMRKSTKKGFKRNYGKSEGKRMIDLYDSMKDSLTETFEQERTDGTDLSSEEFYMLHSFMGFYLKELKSSIREHDEDESFRSLERVDERLNSLKFEGEMMERVIY